MFADAPDFVAGLETVSGTANDTVEVEFRATNLSSSSSIVGGYQVALSFNENTNLLSFENVQSNDWNISQSNNLGDVVSLNDSNTNPAVGKPALTFEFKLLDEGDTSLVFNDTAPRGETQFNDEEGERYDVLFVDGEVTTPSATTTADAVETVDGTTPDSESSFLEFDVDVDSGKSATVTGVNVTKPANQNSASPFDKLDNADPEIELDPGLASGETGQYDGVYTVGTLQSLDTNAVFSDGSRLNVRLGKINSGNVQLKYDQVTSESNSDITVTLQFDDGSSHETYLRVTNVNS